MANIGAFSVSPPANPTLNVFYDTASIAKAASATVTSETFTAAERVTQIYMGGDGYGEFTVKLNGSTWGVFRNSWNERQVLLELNKQFAIGDTLVIEVLNCNLEEASATFDITVLRA